MAGLHQKKRQVTSSLKPDSSKLIDRSKRLITPNASSTTLRRDTSGRRARAVFNIFALCICVLAFDSISPISQLWIRGPGLGDRKPVIAGFVGKHEPVPPNIRGPAWAVQPGPAPEPLAADSQHGATTHSPGHSGPQRHKKSDKEGDMSEPSSRKPAPGWVRQREVLDAKGRARMRTAGRVASRALALAGSLAMPGATTDSIDRAVHRFIVQQGGYPSPLNYSGFPRSICTSVNEVLVHGIPDDRPLVQGDLLKVDVTVYKGGVHADTCASFIVGDSPQSLGGDSRAARVARAARASLAAALRVCGPGVTPVGLGRAAQAEAAAHGMVTVRTVAGHGVGRTFHASPVVPGWGPRGWWDLGGWLHLLMHTSAWTQLVPGQSLTIEPVLVEGGSTGAHWKWRDGWTLSAVDNSLSAQFEVTVVVRSAEEGGGCEVVTPFLTSWKDEADAVGSV